MHPMPQRDYPLLPAGKSDHWAKLNVRSGNSRFFHWLNHLPATDSLHGTRCWRDEPVAENTRPARKELKDNSLILHGFG